MTPILYMQEQLKLIIEKHKDKSIYHWTTTTNSLEILEDGYLYSKGSLWGIKPDKVNLSRSTMHNDAKNGFIDYVFLGVVNWPNLKRPSHYGETAFEFKLDILYDKEFFVFPLNTGMQWNTMKPQQKFSDLTTLMNALEQKPITSEVLVRRRIALDNRYLKSIICPQKDVDTIKNAIHAHRSGLEISVKGY
jgi:hypothetical protein